MKGSPMYPVRVPLECRSEVEEGLDEMELTPEEEDLLRKADGDDEEEVRGER